MLRFTKIVPAEINATNCCRAVQTASRLLEAANPPKTPCIAFNFFGTQLITARESQPPLSSTRKCCAWVPKYWAQCAKEPHKSHCAHCGDTPGPHLVLKYAKQPLQKAVERIKKALDQGCTVAAGVMSGICADKPEVGCARVAKGRCVASMPRALGAHPRVPRGHVSVLGFVASQRPAGGRETHLRSARIRTGDTAAIDGAIRGRSGKDGGEWRRLPHGGLCQRCQSRGHPRFTEALSSTGPAKHSAVSRVGSEQAVR